MVCGRAGRLGRSPGRTRSAPHRVRVSRLLAPWVPTAAFRSPPELGPSPSSDTPLTRPAVKISFPPQGPMPAGWPRLPETRAEASEAARTHGEEGRGRPTPSTQGPGRGGGDRGAAWLPRSPGLCAAFLTAVRATYKHSPWKQSLRLLFPSRTSRVRSGQRGRALAWRSALRHGHFDTLRPQVYIPV